MERELEAARNELDAIDSSREAAEKKLQLLMRKCGIAELPSAKGGSISACLIEGAEEGEANVDDIDGNEVDDSVDHFT